MKKCAWFCFISFCLWAVFSQIDHYRYAELNTPSGPILVSVKERSQLEYLFRELIIYNSAGYTLLGPKPFSFDCVFRPSFKWDFSFLWHTFFPSNLKKYTAWKTWQKYAPFFPMNDFCLWSEQSPWIENGELIVFANKKQLEEIKNQPDFQSWKNLDAMAFFKKALHSHDGLLGTVLGYGKINASYFQEQRKELSPLFSKEIGHLFVNKRAALNYTFGWPRVELECVLMYPTFMADLNTEESQELRVAYLKTREQVLQYYQGKDFLQATLSLLSSSKTPSNTLTASPTI